MAVTTSSPSASRADIALFFFECTAFVDNLLLARMEVLQLIDIEISQTVQVFRKNLHRQYLN